jgi:nitrogen fixation protein NifB
VRWDNRVHRGVQGAELLIARQREAMARLKETPVIVKVNTIVLPGINEGEIADIAADVRANGAEIMNTMAMVPVAGTPFESLGEPPPEMMESARKAAGAKLPQMLHCARCRADACGLVGEEAEGMPDPREFALIANRPGQERPYVAVASREGMLVNQHVGEAISFHIFAERDGEFVSVGIREAPESGSGIKRWLDLADMLHDCRAVLTTGVGSAPRRVLTEHGLDIVEMEGLIDDGLSAVYGGKPIPPSLRRAFKGCGLGCSGGGGGCS